MTTVTDYRNAQYNNALNSSVDLEIETVEFGWLPTTIDLNDSDPESHVVQIKQWLSNNTVSIAAYVADIAALKRVKVQDILSAFANDSAQPVTDTNGDQWTGGFTSAIKLDAAKRLAETAGLSAVIFYDESNAAHSLTFAEATVVILTVAGAYQASLANKQGLLVATTAATSEADLNAINW